ncbi:MAG TPA: NAD-dependent deacylase [Candidatus Hydrogenedens sp.]|nr:NAD-dependent deacylase [Candidatus Hydrogenedens sp.]HOL20073.1 NAD-dependent deacylase [Candidatus Hydrogenedens sp.]HPP59664.1 NAD-dependent deacylase [Candidatus Hydrogenedens sp.]
MNEIMEKTAQIIANSKNVVAVTGAGISVESGIPDFRSPGGLWSKYPPEEYATYEAFIDNPDKVWELFYEIGETISKAKPNMAHIALAKLEELGHLVAVITQNIDNLHYEAGNNTVIEYHGNARTLYCPACGRRRPMSLSHRNHGAPRCECGGFMKPDVVLFGEPIPSRALFTGETLAKSCEVMLVIGTSAQVYPAASLPYTAKQWGAVVIEFNTVRTPFTESVTDYFIEGPVGHTLPEIVRKVEEIDKNKIDK